MLALIAIWIWCRALRSEPKNLTAVFLDVGQGDCTFIRTPSGRTVLIDGGGRPEASDADRMGLSVVEPFLRREGVNRIDLVVLTHPHDDHVQGLVPVVRDFRIGMVLDPGVPHGARSYQRFLSIIHDRRIPYRRAVRGQVINFGDGVQAQVLNPPAGKADVSEDNANDSSAVLRFVYGRYALLMAGDAGTDAESDVIASGVDIRSDVLKVGHHGSRTSTGDEWLGAVRPRFAVISVGKGNQFGHPSPDTLHRLASNGAAVLRTDECGAVTATLAESGVSVRACHSVRPD